MSELALYELNIFRTNLDRRDCKVVAGDNRLQDVKGFADTIEQVAVAGESCSEETALRPVRQVAIVELVKTDHPRRILLVEDSKDNQFLVKAYLRQTAYQLEIAEDGQMGVEKFIAGNFDLVLMDVQMPVMDGYTATRKIREWEKQHGGRPIPILTLSAHSSDEDFERSRSAGCDVHLTKPIRKAILLETLEKYLCHKM